MQDIIFALLVGIEKMNIVQKELAVIMIIVLVQG
jgi:hypothetical protein